MAFGIGLSDVIKFGASFLLGGDGDGGTGGAQGVRQKTVAEKIRDFRTDVGYSQSFVRPPKYKVNFPLTPQALPTKGFEKYGEFYRKKANEYPSVAKRMEMNMKKIDDPEVFTDSEIKQLASSSKYNSKWVGAIGG